MSAVKASDRTWTEAGLIALLKVRLAVTTRALDAWKILRALKRLQNLEARGARWRAGPSACADGIYVGHAWRAGAEARVLPVVHPTLAGCLERLAAAAARAMEDPR